MIGMKRPYQLLLFLCQFTAMFCELRGTSDTIDSFLHHRHTRPCREENKVPNNALLRKDTHSAFMEDFHLVTSYFKNVCGGTYLEMGALVCYTSLHFLNA